MRRTKKFTFFNGKEDVFSAYHYSEFTIKGITFNSVIQFVIYCKALEFNDIVTARKILECKFPFVVSKLEPLIANVKPKYWKTRRVHYYYIGFRHMFTQSPERLDELYATENTQIVFGDPKSNYWGVGLDMYDFAINNPTNWKGHNSLGSLLTQLRDDLQLQGIRNEHTCLERT